MNGKKAKAQRRQQRALEAETLAFQQQIRRQIPVPVQTMSLEDYKKAGKKSNAGIGVIETTPRTPDVDPDALAIETAKAVAIEQEVKIGLIQQNVKHYNIGDELSLTRGDTFKKISPQLLLESRQAAKASGVTPSEEELDRMHASMNGPEAYAKIGSMGNNPLYSD